MNWPFRKHSTPAVTASNGLIEISDLWVAGDDKTDTPRPPQVTSPAPTPAVVNQSLTTQPATITALAAQEIPVALSFTSILSNVGNELKKFFSVAVTVAQAAEPFVAVALPGISALYNATVAEIVSAETAAIAAGAQSGTSAQKLAAVVAAVTPTFTAYAAANGMSTPTTTTITNWVNAAVASLNAIPASTTTTTTA